MSAFRRLGTSLVLVFWISGVLHATNDAPLVNSTAFAAAGPNEANPVKPSSNAVKTGNGGENVVPKAEERFPGNVTLAPTKVAVEAKTTQIRVVVAPAVSSTSAVKDSKQKDKVEAENQVEQEDRGSLDEVKDEVKAEDKKGVGGEQDSDRNLKKDVVQEKAAQNTFNADDFDRVEDSHFVYYLGLFGALVAIMYIFAHNKKKIAGLILEGRRPAIGSRRSSVRYRRLSQREEGESSFAKESETNVIY